MGFELEDDDDDVDIGENFLTLLFLGKDGCTDENPCSLCQGDCDSDKQCGNGLICQQREGDEPVPLCEGEAKTGEDYCIVDESEDSDDAAPAADAVEQAAAEILERLVREARWGYRW